MSPGFALIVLGLVIAVLVSWTLGVVLIIAGFAWWLMSGARI